MKIILKITIFLAVFSIVRNSIACQDYLYMTPAEIAEKSNEVYIGRLTSIAIPELENHLDSLWGAPRVIRVKIYETLKGDRTNIVEVELGCNSGQANLGSMVVLYSPGTWQVEQSDIVINEIRRALTNK